MIRTSWTVSVGDDFTQKLPNLVDPEQNDESEWVVGSIKDKEYPPFLSFDDYANTITFKPFSDEYQGKTYFFSIIVKEKNSETVKYPYNCTIEVLKATKGSGNQGSNENKTMTSSETFTAMRSKFFQYFDYAIQKGNSTHPNAETCELDCNAIKDVNMCCASIKMYQKDKNVSMKDHQCISRNAI